MASPIIPFLRHKDSYSVTVQSLGPKNQCHVWASPSVASSQFSLYELAEMKGPLKPRVQTVWTQASTSLQSARVVARANRNAPAMCFSSALAGTVCRLLNFTRQILPYFKSSCVLGQLRGPSLKARRRAERTLCESKHLFRIKHNWCQSKNKLIKATISGSCAFVEDVDLILNWS